jgi:hypothetical protein
MPITPAIINATLQPRMPSAVLPPPAGTPVGPEPGSARLVSVGPVPGSANVVVGVAVGPTPGSATVVVGVADAEVGVGVGVLVSVVTTVPPPGTGPPPPVGEPDPPVGEPDPDPLLEESSGIMQSLFQIA